jgi:hypothetical protein
MRPAVAPAVKSHLAAGWGAWMKRATTATRGLIALVVASSLSVWDTAGAR